VRVDIRIANLSFTEVGQLRESEDTLHTREHWSIEIMAGGVNSPVLAAKLTSSKSESGLFGKCFIQASQGTITELANVIKTIIPKIQNNIMEKV
jgi:hypothetical protein